MKNRKVFYSRAMDDIDIEEIVQQDSKISESLNEMGFELINPFEVMNGIRESISGISQIVNHDLELLAGCDIVIANLTNSNRTYFGAIMELAYAFGMKKKIHVWVGDSGLENRIWLKYHATSISKTFEELKEIVFLTHTPEGRKINEIRINTYYSKMALEYNNKESIVALPDIYRKYTNERILLEEWISSIKFSGGIVDLGSGTGNYTSVWEKNSEWVLCVDASQEMLNLSKLNNPQDKVRHILGNYLDHIWLGNFLKENLSPNFIVLSFILNLITEDQEDELISLCARLSNEGTKLLIIENQSSLFSTNSYFSRTEIQKREVYKEDNFYRLRKRNFLKDDLKLTLKKFGKIEDVFYSDNYFVGGIASLVLSINQN